MRAWPILLAGLMIWAAHFFALYGIGEFAPDTIGSRVAIGVLTLTCLSAEILVLRTCIRQLGDRFDQWRGQVGALGVGLGAVAIVWQGLVPLF